MAEYSTVPQGTAGHGASSEAVFSLGAFHTSLVYLYVEANEPSQNNRRIKLAMQYVIKLKTNTLNPAYTSVFERKNEFHVNIIWRF